MQKGGIVTSPTIAQIAERGPEAVIPLEKIPEIVPTSNTVLVNVITPEFVAESLKYHPDVVVNTVTADVLRNGPTIQAIRRKVR
ncbi:MAG: hypothetical protein ACTSRP_01995 [Candidatus Helarchaeota archaeon]